MGLAGACCTSFREWAWGGGCPRVPVGSLSPGFLAPAPPPDTPFMVLWCAHQTLL